MTQLKASPYRTSYLTNDKEKALVSYLIDASGPDFGYSLKSLKILIRRLFAMGETGIHLSTHSRYVIAEKGVRNVLSLTPDNRQHVTLVCHASASGGTWLPLFHYSEKNAEFPGRSL